MIYQATVFIFNCLFCFDEDVIKCLGELPQSEQYIMV